MIEVAIDLPRPPAEVWTEVERLETHHEWMAEAETIRFVGSRTRGVGTRMVVPTKVGPFRTEDVIEVVEWEPPRRIGVIHRGTVSGVGAFELHPAPTGTRFVWREELEIPWYLGGRLSRPIVEAVLRRVWSRNLSRLAARLDGGTAGGGPSA